MANKFEEIKAKVASLEADAEKFYVKGNKNAGRRVRIGLLAIKNLAHEARLEISAMKEAGEK